MLQSFREIDQANPTDHRRASEFFTPKGFHLKAQGRGAHPGVAVAVTGAIYPEGVPSSMKFDDDSTPSGYQETGCWAALNRGEQIAALAAKLPWPSFI
jgi:hypothetical protein